MSVTKEIVKSLWLVVTIATGISLLMSCAAPKTESIKKQAAIETLEGINNPESEFKVELWVDREDATYKVGDDIKFSFKANKNCRLTIFNVGTSGKVTILYPNEHQKDNSVKADSTYTIPTTEANYVFKAAGPAGEEMIKVIATIDEVTLVTQNDLQPVGPFQEVTKPEPEMVKDITIALKPVPVKKWTEAEKIVKVVE